MSETPRHTRHPVLLAILSAAVGSIVTVILTPVFPNVYSWAFGDPIPIDKTPQQILDWYKAFPNEAQAQVATKQQYYGKFLRVVGPIEDISVAMNTGQGVVSIGAVSLFCDPEVAALYQKGEKVVIVGRISWISSSGLSIQLQEGRITSIE